MSENDNVNAGLTTILLVEDSAVQGETLKRILRQEGYSVQMAKNGEEGLKMAKELRPLLILTDIVMPVMDGYQMCRKIKDDKTIGGTPVLLLTQLYETDEIIKGLESGADGFFTKTISKETLLSKIKIILENPIQFQNVPEKKCISFVYEGKHYEIHSTRTQTLSFLFSTYENAICQNRELKAIQEQLRSLNEMLEERVKERTAALTEEISVRQKAEDELKKYQEQLEDKVVERTETLREKTVELEEARRVADQANQAKGDFLANMSHEIRTPLNAVIGFSDLIGKTKLTPKQFDYIRKIRASGRSLLGIINDVLDFSKIEARKLMMEKKAFQLETVFSSLTALLSQKIAEKGLEFSIDAPTEFSRNLVGDPMRLGQILINLVGNSIKFTKKGKIEIKVVCLEETVETVKLGFTVRDTGIGLTPAQSARLFQPFSQADRTTSGKFGGTGLGLSICKHLVELMGGGISVESTSGKGTAFSFTAVFEWGSKAEDKFSIFPEDLKGGKVLLVDGDSKFQATLVKMLQKFPMEVEIVGSGREAIDKVKNRIGRAQYKIIIFTIKLPDNDGIALARDIKECLEQKEFPMLITIAKTSEENRRGEAYEAGVHNFILEPLTISTLADAIMSFFSNSENSFTEVGLESLKETSELMGARVLVVEDNEINQDLARELLEAAGLMVDLAGNGVEAIEKLNNASKESPYDAVLMDIQMPELDGYETTLRLRLEPRFAGLPIIAMTANAMTGDREKVMLAGMNDFTTKPIDPDELMKTLKKWIKPGPPKNPGKKETTFETDATEKRCRANYGCHPERSEGGVPVENIAPYGRYDTHPTGLMPIHHYPATPFETLMEADFSRFPGINFQEGLRWFSGNKEKYAAMLMKFLHSQDQGLKDIEIALEQNDSKKAKILVHSFKGNAKNLAITEAFQSAQALENAILQEDWENAAKLLNGLQQTCDRLLEAFEKNLGRAETGGCREPMNPPFPKKKNKA